MQRLAEYDGGWKLFDLGPTGNGWTTLHLTRPKKGNPKHSWWFAHNGERLAQSSDLVKLTAHHPEIAAQVAATLALPIEKSIPQKIP